MLVASLPPGSLAAWDSGGQALPHSGRGFLPPMAGEPRLPGTPRPDPPPRETVPLPPPGSAHRSGSPHNKVIAYGPDIYPASTAVPATPGSSSGAPTAQAPSGLPVDNTAIGPSGSPRPEAPGEAPTATPTVETRDDPVSSAAAGAVADDPPDAPGTLPLAASGLIGRAPRDRVRFAALAAEAWLARDGAQLPLHLQTPEELADLLAEVAMALILIPGRDPHP